MGLNTSGDGELVLDRFDGERVGRLFNERKADFVLLTTKRLNVGLKPCLPFEQRMDPLTVD